MTAAARFRKPPRLMQSLRDLALRGMSPEAMALSIALGFVLGVFPVPGCPTLLCALAALALRLNGPAVQAVNYLVCARSCFRPRDAPKSIPGS